MSESAAELDRLRAEVAELQAKLEARSPGGRLLLARKVVAVVLVVLAGFGTVASVIGIWGARTTLNTERWVATVAPLPREPQVNAAMATYLTGQVFDRLDVQERLAQALPPKAGFLAGPVTKAVQDYMRGTVQDFMATERFQELWNSANRVAHAKILAVLEDRSETVDVQGGIVTLNLLPIVNDILVALEERLPTMFGKRLDLPALSAGQVPPELRERIETALGVTLPADFAQIKLYDSGRLHELQQAVVAFERGLALLVAGTLAALVLALVISPGRRRTVLQLGLAVSVSVVVLSSVLRAVRDQLLAQVPEGLYREGVSVALHEVFTLLRERGDQLLWLGILIALVAYLAGPGRLPVTGRRYVAEGARGTARTVQRVATGDELRRWTAEHLDPLRIGGIVAAAILALVFSSWTALIVIALLLVAYEALVTLVARWGRPLMTGAGNSYAR